MAGLYKKIKILGSGSFGQAWLVEARFKKYVIKEIRITGMSDKDKKLSLNEVSVLARCKHLNIIRYKDAFVENGLLHIVMEHATEGDLHTRILNQKGLHLEETLILGWFVQICFALNYIHSRNILHRDMKSQNIFLSTGNIVKLGDFGICCVLENSLDHANTAIGTPYYLSPEICQHKPYDHKSDMWSAGCVLYEMVSLHYAFDGSTFTELVMKITQGTYKPIPSHYSPLLEDIISVLLRVKPEGRPSAEQILCIPTIQPYVDMFITKQNLQRKTCQSSTSTPSPSEMPPCKRRCIQEKENIDPNKKPVDVTRARKHSLSTPDRQDCKLKAREVNSADPISSRKKVPCKLKVSLYKDIIAKKQKSVMYSKPQVKSTTYTVNANNNDPPEQTVINKSPQRSTAGTYTVPKAISEERKSNKSAEYLYQLSTADSSDIYTVVEMARCFLEEVMGIQTFLKCYGSLQKCLSVKANWKDMLHCYNADGLDTFPLLLRVVQIENSI